MLGIAIDGRYARADMQPERQPLLDLDWSHGRFSLAGIGYGSEAALLSAAQGTRDGSTLQFGPVVVGSERVINGTFDTDITGWGNADAPGALALSWSAGKLNMARGVGPFGAARQEVEAGGPHRALRIQFTNSIATIRFSPIMNGGGAVVESTTYDPGSWTVFGATGPASPAGRINVDFWPNDTDVVAQLDDVSIVEVAPLAGHDRDAVGVVIRATAAADRPGNQTLLQLDAGGEQNRISLQWGVDDVLRVLTTRGGAAQVALALGPVAPGAAFAVQLSCAAGEVFGRLDGADWVAATGGDQPGLGMLRIGRSSVGDAWTGSMQRVAVYAGPTLERHKLALWGDSLAQSLASGLGSALVPNRPVYNGGAGGEDTTAIAARMLADEAYRDHIVVLWERANTAGDNSTYLGKIAEMISRVRQRHSRFIVISDINATDGLEEPGSDWRMAQDSRNAVLAARYQENFLDLVELLDDAELRSDDLHLNASGRGVAAAAIGAFLGARGW